MPAFQTACFISGMRYYLVFTSVMGNKQRNTCRVYYLCAVMVDINRTRAVCAHSVVVDVIGSARLARVLGHCVVTSVSRIAILRSKMYFVHIY